LSCFICKDAYSVKGLVQFIDGMYEDVFQLFIKYHQDDRLFYLCSKAFFSSLNLELKYKVRASPQSHLPRFCPMYQYFIDFLEIHQPLKFVDFLLLIFFFSNLKQQFYLEPFFPISFAEQFILPI